jgi:uncharacterized protein
MHSTLLLFTKVPDPGRVKTRLTGAQGLTPLDASNLYAAILVDIFEIMRTLAQSVDAKLHIAYWPENEGSKIKDLFAGNHGENVSFFPQDEKQTTSGRIASALENAFGEGSDIAVLVFGDQAEIDGRLLRQALRTLEAAAEQKEQHLVLGPTCDGGTYLIGVTSTLASWLHDAIDCTSSNKAVSRLIVKARNSNVPVTILDELVDLDDIDDLNLIKSRPLSNHPRTESMIKTLPPVPFQDTGSTISVVIPTLNEEKTLESTIAPIRAQSCRTEIIVVDGGSEDKTLETANRLADRVIVTNRRGRQHQENVGAMGARGDIILFLHGDTIIPPTFLQSITTSFRDPEKVAGGAHLMYSPPNRFRYKALCAFRDIMSKSLGISGMGSSFFIRRNMFWTLGGFDENMNEEAVDMCKRLRGVGKHIMLKEIVHTSARRYERTGFVKTVFAWALTVTLSYMGIRAVAIEKYVWRVVR